MGQLHYLYTLLQLYVHSMYVWVAMIHGWNSNTRRNSAHSQHMVSSCFAQVNAIIGGLAHSLHSAVLNDKARTAMRGSVVAYRWLS